jgi:SAM-dependent methyltransferase
MAPRLRFISALATALAVVAALGAQGVQEPPAAQLKQERAQAEADVPKLVDALELKPGMTVADVGAGNGNMSVVLARWIGTGRVIATDIPADTVSWLREYVKREALTNITVLEGAAAKTNLPDACCDAIFLQNVYHHLTAPDAFNQSLRAALKPGGRLAIIDAPSGPKSALPEGVPANREGHGVPVKVVEAELLAAGLVHVKTITNWPPGDKRPSFLVLFRKS